MPKKPISDPEFYKRMLAAKKRKQEALEQLRIRAEFGDIPLPPNIIVKPLSEAKMDQAFQQLKDKLRAEAGPTPQDKIQEAFQHIIRKSEGL